MLLFSKSKCMFATVNIVSMYCIHKNTNMPHILFTWKRVNMTFTPYLLLVLGAFLFTLSETLCLRQQHGTASTSQWFRYICYVYMCIVEKHAVQRITQEGAAVAEDDANDAGVRVIYVWVPWTGEFLRRNICAHWDSVERVEGWLNILCCRNIKQSCVRVIVYMYIYMYMDGMSSFVLELVAPSKTLNNL